MKLYTELAKKVLNTAKRGNGDFIVWSIYTSKIDKRVKAEVTVDTTTKSLCVFSMQNGTYEQKMIAEIYPCNIQYGELVTIMATLIRATDMVSN